MLRSVLRQAVAGFLSATGSSCVVAAFLLGGAPAIAADHTKNVLVLYSNGRLLPANIEVDRGLRASIIAPAGGRVALYDEFLDVPRFRGEDYVRTMNVYLREKYALHPPDVIVAAGDNALKFVLANRPQFHPDVAVIHVGVTSFTLRSLGKLPVDVIGAPAIFDFGGTIAQALRWHPRARRLVIVTGASEMDRNRESELRHLAPRFSSTVSVEFLAGLPTQVAMNRLRALDRDTVVFTTGYDMDGDGREFLPRDAVRLLAAASSAPVYGAYQTQMDTGIVGGRYPEFEAMGRQVGGIASALLAGVAPSTLSVPEPVPARLNVDWRQIRRWGIRENAIPRNAIVHFRKPTLLEQYRDEVIATLVLVLLQAALITVLLVERRRRRIAEVARVKQRSELAHASRLAVAGELIASIAHEINQPLSAILTNAEAAELILDSGGDPREALRQILGDIRRDDLRASEVIRRLRALLARHEVEQEPFEVNGAVRDAAALLHFEARRRGIWFDVRPATNDVHVVGDRVQIQQVLLNLMLNAMDAITDMPDTRRVVSVAVNRVTAGIQISVRDRGEGIDPDDLPKLFDSFFTTKKRGMGLGLSIARSIVETHGGRIRAESLRGEGAVFFVELPEADGVRSSSRGAA